MKIKCWKHFLLPMRSSSPRIIILFVWMLEVIFLLLRLTYFLARHGDNSLRQHCCLRDGHDPLSKESRIISSYLKVSLPLEHSGFVPFKGLFHAWDEIKDKITTSHSFGHFSLPRGRIPNRLESQGASYPPAQIPSCSFRVIFLFFFTLPVHVLRCSRLHYGAP